MCCKSRSHNSRTAPLAAAARKHEIGLLERRRDGRRPRPPRNRPPPCNPSRSRRCRRTRRAFKSTFFSRANRHQRRPLVVQPVPALQLQLPAASVDHRIDLGRQAPPSAIPWSRSIDRPMPSPRLQATASRPSSSTSTRLSVNTPSKSNTSSSIGSGQAAAVPAGGRPRHVDIQVLLLDRLLGQVEVDQRVDVDAVVDVDHDRPHAGAGERMLFGDRRRADRVHVARLPIGGGSFAAACCTARQTRFPSAAAGSRPRRRATSCRAFAWESSRRARNRPADRLRRMRDRLVDHPARSQRRRRPQLHDHCRAGSLRARPASAARARTAGKSGVSSCGQFGGPQERHFGAIVPGHLGDLLVVGRHDHARDRRAARPLAML